MKDTKFFRLLASLNVYEQKRFRKYLCSPLHNEDQTFIALFDLVLPCLTERSVEPSRALIGKKLFPKKKMSNLDYARLFSNFARRIEGFMALEQYYSRPVREYTDLLEVLNRKHLGKYFPDMFSYVKKLHVRETVRYGEYYLNTYRIEALHHEYLEEKQERRTNKNLLETLSALDIFYLVTKLRYCAAMLHYQEFLSLEGEIGMIHEILAHCADGRYDSVPLLRAYYYTVMSLIEPDREEYFESMKDILFTHADSIYIEAQQDLFAFAIVYCINKINYGNILYQRRIFELYKEALNKNIMTRDGELSQWDYKNIVTIGLRNKEFKWVDGFIDKYKMKLSKAERDNAYTFNRARYYFAIAKYDKVLDLLQGVEYNDIFYLLDSKTTLMKTYYEMGEYQPLQSLKESFRILLRRKKLISELNQVNYGNFARFAMKLYRADVKNKSQMASLRKQIESTTNIADRSWILEKLAEIGG